MLTAAAAWDVLATQLYAAASAYGLVISDLAALWLGPSSIDMETAAAPFVTWISTTADLVEATGTQAKAAAAAYEAAFAMTVPPPVIAANRALLHFLVATNWFGQNTPAIMATEAHYMEMWAQDATAMYGYAAAALAASTLAPFTPAPLMTAADALAAQAGAVEQAVQTAASTAAQTVSQLSSMLSTQLSSLLSGQLSSIMSGELSTLLSGHLTTMMSSQVSSMMSGQLGSMLSGQLGTAAYNVVPGVATATTTMGSTSSSTSPAASWATAASLPTALSSGLASGAGSVGSMSTLGMSAGALMQSMGPTASLFGGHLQSLGYAVGNGIGSGTGVFGMSGMSSMQVTAGVGRAASLGMLSVPQSWASTAPAFNQIGSAFPPGSMSATPAAAPAASPAAPNGMPIPGKPAPTRGSDNPGPPPLKAGFRPTVVQEPVYVG
ncbi:hypothetical protein A5679_13305 [Mycobacterium scrofulaceum]|uniref:PPE family protein n=2 Tax=Mycobacterium scrofulaceum TaxID=1783 RepID=A0A1A2VY32_MYCSC|nr:hypothetical protein A5679_13305 [Mycobacterium scrofulaceum]